MRYVGYNHSTSDAMTTDECLTQAHCFNRGSNHGKNSVSETGEQTLMVVTEGDRNAQQPRAIACCRVQPPDTASSNTCACCIMLGARLACTHLLVSCHQQRHAKEICCCAECARTALTMSYALATDV